MNETQEGGVTPGGTSGAAPTPPPEPDAPEPDAPEPDTVVSGVPAPLTPSPHVVDRVIKNHVMAAVAAGVVPVPGVDLAAAVGIQIALIRRLSALHGRPFSQNAGKAVVTALTGGAAGVGSGRLAASALKLIPGVGWGVGFVTVPVMNGAATYAVGKVVDRHYREGGALLDLSADAVRDTYAEAVRAGKDLSRRALDTLRRKKKGPTAEDEAGSAA
ncbi:YcjF family protein [Pararhodospirillum photometricum]|nr:DUF697 domain-containing protein [Pararhodospirillum photometricum]